MPQPHLVSRVFLVMMKVQVVIKWNLGKGVVVENVICTHYANDHAQTQIVQTCFEFGMVQRMNIFCCRKNVKSNASRKPVI